MLPLFVSSSRKCLYFSLSRKCIFPPVYHVFTRDLFPTQKRSLERVRIEFHELEIALKRRAVEITEKIEEEVQQHTIFHFRIMGGTVAYVRGCFLS